MVACRSKPELRIFQDSERLSRHAANLFIEESNKSIRERDRFLVALNGGEHASTSIFNCGEDYSKKIDWSKVHVFWGDERCVPPDDEGSNYHQANELLLSKVSLTWK
ncbi:MAG: 6-phosphogluconolactonase [Anaerolineales bacterium]